MAEQRQRLPPLDVRRAEICRTAAQIIHVRGFHATSLSDIAQTLGLTKSGLYHYISSKEALLFEIMNFGMDQIEAEVIAPVKALGDPEDRLRQIVIRYVSIATRAHGAVAQIGHEARALPAVKRQKIDQRARTFFDLVRDTLRELQEAGRLRSIDLTVAAFTVLGAAAWVPRWFRQGGRLTAEQVANDVARAVLGGLVRPAMRRARPKPPRLVDRSRRERLAGAEARGR